MSVFFFSKTIMNFKSENQLRIIWNDMRFEDWFLSFCPLDMKKRQWEQKLRFIILLCRFMYDNMLSIYWCVRRSCLMPDYSFLNQIIKIFFQYSWKFLESRNGATILLFFFTYLMMIMLDATQNCILWKRKIVRCICCCFSNSFGFLIPIPKCIEHVCMFKSNKKSEYFVWNQCRSLWMQAAPSWNTRQGCSRERNKSLINIAGNGAGCFSFVFCSWMNLVWIRCFFMAHTHFSRII